MVDTDEFVRYLTDVSTKVDSYQSSKPFRQIAENCRRRGGSGCGGVSAMDGATEPYLRKICQRRCREPAWAAVRAWISTIAM